MSPKPVNRRDFLKSGLALGLGIGVPSVTGLHSSNNSAKPFESAMPRHLELDGSLRSVHDPAIIKADDAYYLYSTGIGISVRRSEDMINWEMSFPSRVFTNLPEWAREAIPNQNDAWAPDISYYNGKYHLYYSVSTFGSNRSVIGLATNATLNPDDDNFGWEDQGLVIESTNANNYNCIDPNLIIDADGNSWLAFGSFWSGLKMRRIDYETGKLSEEDPLLYSLAQRFTNSGSIEAPFIIRKGDDYYLFASFDFCCRGVDSTYNVRVGRSPNVNGPYFDRSGRDMLEGGGTQITFPTDRWKGPGHNSILQENDTEYIVYHAYDAESQGVPTLRIDQLVWDEEGWPSLATSE